MSRREQREEAFKTLFASEVKGRYKPDHRADFTRELVEGVRDHQETIDEQLSTHLTDWRMDRIHPVERVLLRIGTYEILYTGTSKAVVINEAVELAKKYGDEKTPSFVNGILDNFAKPAPDQQPSS